MILKKYTLIVSAFLICFSIQAQDLTFEEYNPISTLVVPGKIIKKSKFPFIDVHGHQYRMPNQDLAPVVAAMDTLNEAIMVNLSGRTGEELIKSVKNIENKRELIDAANKLYDNANLVLELMPRLKSNGIEEYLVR